MLAALGRSAKYIVVGIAVLVVLFLESPQPVYYVASGVFNAFLSKTIKMIVKEPRPAGSKKPGYGMPSSHSQSIFYFASVLTLMLLQSDLRKEITIVSMLAIWSYSYLACSWRVKSRLHSLSQTLVGAILGISVGYLATCFEDTFVSLTVNVTGFHHGVFPFWMRAAMCFCGVLIMAVDTMRKKEKRYF